MHKRNYYSSDRGGENLFELLNTELNLPTTCIKTFSLYLTKNTLWLETRAVCYNRLTKYKYLV